MDRPGVCNGHECNVDCPALDCLHHLNNPDRIDYCPYCGKGFDVDGNCSCVDFDPVVAGNVGEDEDEDDDCWTFGCEADNDW